MSGESSAGIIVYSKEGGKYEFLLLHYEAGHWDFPKGHVEEGESLKQTAIRETEEETGLCVPIKDEGFKEQFSYIYRGKDGLMKQKTVYFFMGEADSKEVRLSHEHIGYEWLSYENAYRRLTYDNAKEVLEKANYHLHQKTLSDY